MVCRRVQLRSPRPWLTLQERDDQRRVSSLRNMPDKKTPIWQTMAGNASRKRTTCRVRIKRQLIRVPLRPRRAGSGAGNGAFGCHQHPSGPALRIRPAYKVSKPYVGLRRLGCARRACLRAGWCTDEAYALDNNAAVPNHGNEFDYPCDGTALVQGHEMRPTRVPDRCHHEPEDVAEPRRTPGGSSARM